VETTLNGDQIQNTKAGGLCSFLCFRWDCSVVCQVATFWTFPLINGNCFRVPRSAFPFGRMRIFPSLFPNFETCLDDPLLAASSLPSPPLLEQFSAYLFLKGPLHCFLSQRGPLAYALESDDLFPLEFKRLPGEEFALSRAIL